MDQVRSLRFSQVLLQANPNPSLIWPLGLVIGGRPFENSLHLPLPTYDGYRYSLFHLFQRLERLGYGPTTRESQKLHEAIRIEWIEIPGKGDNWDEFISLLRLGFFGHRLPPVGGPTNKAAPRGNLLYSERFIKNIHIALFKACWPAARDLSGKSLGQISPLTDQT
jgi:hypothetical protein